MFITAVCVLFLVKLRWPKNKSLYETMIMMIIRSNQIRGRRKRKKKTKKKKKKSSLSPIVEFNPIDTGLFFLLPAATEVTQKKWTLYLLFILSNFSPHFQLLSQKLTCLIKSESWLAYKEPLTIAVMSLSVKKLKR